MLKQLWTVKIDYEFFDPAKKEDWNKIKSLNGYAESNVVAKSDDGNTGDIFITVSNKNFAKEISKLFDGATITPSIIVNGENVHLLHYPQYLITNIEID
jgi:hypothetical protein